MNEEQITSPVRKSMDEINELFKGIRSPLNKFLENVGLYIRTKDERDREKYRQIADEESTRVLKDLLRIVNIAEKINYQTSKNIAIRRMQDIWENREKIRLKTEKLFF